MSFVAERGTVGTAGTALSSLTLALTAPTAITVGNTLVVHLVLVNPRTLNSVTDTAGNTWNILAGPFAGTTVGSHIAWCKVTSAFGAAGSVTMTLSSTTHWGATVQEYGPVVGVDKTSQQASVDGTSTTFTSGTTAATAASDLLLVGHVAVLSTSATTPTDPAWAALTSTTTVSYTRTVYPYWRSRATAGTVVFDGTMGTARWWTAMAVAFEKVATVATPTGLSVVTQGDGLRSTWSSGGSEFVLERQRWTGPGSPP